MAIPWIGHDIRRALFLSGFMTPQNQTLPCDDYLMNTACSMNFKFSKSNCIAMSPLIIFLLCLIASSILTPYFLSIGMMRCANFCNVIPNQICHQLPTRCYLLFDSNVALCARCFSFFLSMLIFSIGWLFVQLHLQWRLKLILFYSLIAFLVLDGASQYLHLRTSTNTLRTATGFMAGIGTSIMLIPVYHEKMTFLINKMWGD